MSREEMYNLLVEVLNLESEKVNEETELDCIEFDSIAKLGVISVIDAYENKIVPAVALGKCKTIGDIVDLAFMEDLEG